MRLIFFFLASFAFSEPVYILNETQKNDLLQTIGDLRKWQTTLQTNLEDAEKNSELLSKDLQKLREDLKRTTESLKKSLLDLQLSQDNLTNIEKDLQTAQTSLAQLSKDLTDLRQRSFLWNMLIGSGCLLTGLAIGLIF